METTLSFLENARLFFQALSSVGVILPLCILVPLGTFLLFVTSLLFIVCGNMVYLLFKNLLPGEEEVKSNSQKDDAEKNKIKYSITALISLIAAIGTLMLGVGTYQGVQETKRSNDLKEQEIRMHYQQKHSSNVLTYKYSKLPKDM